MVYCKANNCYQEYGLFFDFCSYHLKCLVKLQAQENISSYEIRVMENFDTWFSKNCGYIISEDNSTFYVRIVIYEPSVRNMGENTLVIKHHTSFGSLSEASSKAWELKNKLQNNDFHTTPMLYVHPKANSYEYFSSLITSPYVIKEYLPCDYEGFLWNNTSRLPASAEFYLKPLDIVWVKRSHENWEKDYNHVGIYLGKDKWGENQVCHLANNKGVKINTWKEFLEAGTCKEIIRFHPMIPFKHWEKISKQIGWAWSDNWREECYDLSHRNCEHFSNMIIYGINYSKQVEDSKALGFVDGAGEFWKGFFAIPTLGASLAIDINHKNNDKGSTIKLVNEMSESNDKLGWKTNDWSKQIEEQAKIEVPPKECKVM